jgi:hypothetical protein
MKIEYTGLVKCEGTSSFLFLFKFCPYMRHVKWKLAVWAGKTVNNCYSIHASLINKMLQF